MTHRFPIKEIALQARMSTATVDRVLNGRPNVSPQTRARVRAAIQELEGQEAQLAARGRRVFIDVVVEAPARFREVVQAATESILPDFGAAVCRPRFVMQDIMREEDVLATLARIAKRGSQGICLKARDHPAIRDAVDKLAMAGIPVVTLVTDIPTSNRIAYVGLDNASAGRTAAYLLAQTLSDAKGSVLTSQSDPGFLGEEDRHRAFVGAMARLCPGLKVVAVSGGGGLPYETTQRVARVMDQIEDLVAVYSMGGGNRAILGVLDQNGQRPRHYIAHDLDHENRALLQAGRISFVLHHDLRQDMRNAFRVILQDRQSAQANDAQAASPVQVITPMNIPASDARGL